MVRSVTPEFYRNVSGCRATHSRMEAVRSCPVLDGLAYLASWRLFPGVAAPAGDERGRDERRAEDEHRVISPPHVRRRSLIATHRVREHGRLELGSGGFDPPARIDHGRDAGIRGAQHI